MVVNNESMQKGHYLPIELKIALRFSDTDAMGVVWHGNYLRYFEDAREYFGQQYRLDNLTIHASGFFTPIVHSELNYKYPLYYGQHAIVRAKLIYTSAAKVVFDYELFNESAQSVSCTGTTTQVFLDATTRELSLTKPDFIINWESQQVWQKNDVLQ